MRHALVAAFAVAGYAGSAHRGLKPFNPLERETYSLTAPERRLRFLAEKARHHPPELAWHAHSYDDAHAEADASAQQRRWVAWGAAALTPRFTGRRLELRPSGGTAVRFFGADCADPETFTWSKVTTLVGNLILGPLAVGHAGVMRVRSDATAAAWSLRFRDVAVPDGAAGGASAAAHAAAATSAPPCVAGQLAPGSASLAGTWYGALTWQEGPEAPPQPLWHRAQAPGAGPASGRAGEHYKWSAFMAGLNELPSADVAVPGSLPPTDSRLRPDQRLLEQGRYAAANAQKQRLEEKQRAARARAASAGGPPPPRWFRRAEPPAALAEDAKGLWYEYAGGYWEAAAAREWGDAPRIFD